jgi:hypothetical protein
VAIDEQVFTQSDGVPVTVARFLRSDVSYNLHIGSHEPPTNGATLGPESGPAVGVTEQPNLLACFNGGFKANAGVGGVETKGRRCSLSRPVRPAWSSTRTAVPRSACGDRPSPPRASRWRASARTSPRSS